MRICITSSGPNLDSLIDPRFGRCFYFIFIEDNNLKEIKALENKGVDAIRGARVQSAQTVIDERAEIVITGNIGPNSFSILNSSLIKVFQSPAGKKIGEVINLFKEGKLLEIKIPGGAGFGRRGFGQRRRRI